MTSATITKPRTAKTPMPLSPGNIAPPIALRFEKATQESLEDLLDQAKTICKLLAHNYGGDGSFPVPSTAPGVHWFPDLVASLLGKAETLVCDISGLGTKKKQAITHAFALADHLNQMSNEEMYGDSAGFRLGDHVVAMGYWTIEKLVDSAMLMPVSGARS